MAAYMWAANRTLDGIDGVIARARNQQTDFGGYLDIICDFWVYALIPIGVVCADPSSEKWFWCAFMEGTFFVNAASLFFLAAILEKATQTKKKKELTTVTMPPALIEGAETVVFFSLFIVLQDYTVILYQLFSAGVTFNILQRLYWAYKHLQNCVAFLCEYSNLLVYLL
eukprot:TRINITY_DN2450_c0_g1_i13.p1 TRINITY_DN2450_c0_g1~~TRINITY_DN2450_c0_g1_i13.p1  ORF type:complete len:169 (+),score=4.94 TRINITY_DN2450_c0_g1_i13:145-651(+)